MDDIVKRLRARQSMRTWSGTGDTPKQALFADTLCHEAAAEIDRLNNALGNYRASHDALRDWAQECRDQVLYLLAQQDNELGRVADGLGQSSAGLLGPNVRAKPATTAGTEG